MMVVINYGISNILSIINMLQKCGCNPVIANERRQIENATKIILPGIGAFDRGIQGIKETGFFEILDEVVLKHRIPILGICLGMQMMCKASEEGKLSGFGWFDAEVRRFKMSPGDSFKVPNMGWNVVRSARDNPLIPMDDEEQRYYFVHSYHVVCNQRTDILATAHYGYEFVAAINHDNLYGVQFHPEKSHRFGLALLKRFVDL